MIASSTREPIAIAIPPSDIVLIVIPSICITRMAPSSESGMASREIIVVLKLPRNRKRMSTTKSAPSSSALPTFLTEVSMKSA